jgi:hypothetical protein
MFLTVRPTCGERSILPAVYALISKRFKISHGFGAKLASPTGIPPWSNDRQTAKTGQLKKSPETNQQTEKKTMNDQRIASIKGLSADVGGN